MKKALLLALILTAVVDARPCSRGHSGGVRRGGYRGGRLARGPMLAPVGGTLPSYNPQEKKNFTRFDTTPFPAGCRRTSPAWAASQNPGTFQIRRSVESAPPGY